MSWCQSLLDVDDFFVESAVDDDFFAESDDDDEDVEESVVAAELVDESADDELVELDFDEPLRLSFL